MSRPKPLITLVLHDDGDLHAYPGRDFDQEHAPLMSAVWNAVRAAYRAHYTANGES